MLVDVSRDGARGARRRERESVSRGVRRPVEARACASRTGANLTKRAKSFSMYDGFAERTAHSAPIE